MSERRIHKKLYFVSDFSEFALKILKGIESKKSGKKLSNNNVIIISTNYIVYKKLTSKGIHSVFIEDYLPSDKSPDYFNDNYNLIKRFDKVKVAGKEWKELLSFNGISLWDAYDALIWRKMFRLIPQIFLFVECLKAERPDKIFVIGNGDTFRKVSLINQILRLNANVKHLTDAQNTLSEFFDEFAKILFLKIKKFRPFVEYIMLCPKFFFRRLNINKKKKKILFYLSTRNHFFNAHPIIKRLSTNENVEIKTICLDLFLIGKKAKVARELSKTKIDFNRLQEYSSISLLKRILRGYGVMNRCWRLIEKNKDSLEEVLFHNVNFTPLLMDYFKRLVLYELQYIIYYFELIREMLRKEKPDMIVLFCEFNHDSKVLINLARERNIILYYVQHSILYESPLTKQLFSDFMAIDGIRTKMSLEGYGIDSNKLIVAGRPCYDDVIKNKDMIDESIYKKFGIDKTKKIVLLATNPVGEDNSKKLITTVVNTVKEFENMQLIIKPHPQESIDFYKSLLSELNYNENAVINYNTFELIKIADIVMVVHSTVGLEAMMLDKPVICINLFNLPESVPYVESGAAIGVYKEEELKGVIQKIMMDSEEGKKLAVARKNFAEEFNYKNDGKATDRVADSILKILDLS